jgi:thiol-disulfide isomerase/thioredoxin
MRASLPFVLFGVAVGAAAASAGDDMPAFKVERWVNSAPLTADMLRGKVVLVDFWEYTCINWIRTAPYVKAWNRDYADRGLVVVGVHAPEFEFGKRAEHIDRGIRDHGLGEGSYGDIEAEIRRLLVAANPGTKLPPISPEVTAFAKIGEPSYAGITGETYVGSERREPGAFTLEGTWQSSRQYVELKSGTGKIVLPFRAGEVNMVMQPGASGKAAVAVVLDGKPVGEARGADVGADGVARFDRSGMIRLIARAPRGSHVLTLVASDPGLRAYVFTFGP